MQKIDAKSLLEKYKLGSLTPEEKNLLKVWYAKTAKDNALIIDEFELEKNLDEAWSNIAKATQPKKYNRFTIWARLSAAAIFVLVAGIWFYLYQAKSAVGKSVQTQQQIAVIKPGGNRATLTLANGNVITLDDANDGKLADQNGIVVTKTKDGQLIYSISNRQNVKPTFNTISTPKGGQYQIHLPDGSKVWLNAASSLKYPTFFSGSQRKVNLTGEAYFEVSKANSANGKNMPFVVASQNQEVTVLGTHFNVNCYTDEDASKTTLLEGAVNVTSFKKDNIKTVSLKPGQQSEVNLYGLKVANVNAEEAIAWKNGVFLFKDADLKTVMRQISRWYDVDVAYEGKLPNNDFSGEISRNLNLNQVFEILSFYKVHFRVEGKQIIVSQ